MNVPTHEEVASVLDDNNPAIAKMIRDAGKENPQKNCWGDLTMQAQHDFDPRDVAAAFRRFALKGWKRMVVLTWCPLTDSLWVVMERAKRLQAEYSTWSTMDERDRKMRTRTIYGVISHVRDQWKLIRKAWMKRWSLKDEHDPAFFNSIILHLEGLAAKEKTRCAE